MLHVQYYEDLVDSFSITVQLLVIEDNPMSCHRWTMVPMTLRHFADNWVIEQHSNSSDLLETTLEGN